MFKPILTNVMSINMTCLQEQCRIETKQVACVKHAGPLPCDGLCEMDLKGKTKKNFEKYAKLINLVFRVTNMPKF